MDPETRHGLDALIAIQAAQQIAISALIQTHPDHTGMQLALMQSLEIALAGKSLAFMTEAQRQVVRDTVEWLGAVHSRTAHRDAPAPPLRT
jgi:hypothetical protein